MSENFYTILTATGKAKLANSAVLGSKVNFKTLKVGDGNGAYYEPTESQTSLVREVWSGNVSSISVDENNPNWIVAETLIPATIGGFFIREAGIFDEDGDLIAISKLSETYKPVVSEGSIKDLCIKIILEVSNVASVTLKIDPTVIVATRKDIDVLQAKMDASNAQTEEEIKELDSKISEQISELANEISNKTVVTPAVGYGMNNVIKNVGETSVSPKFTIQGKTVVNLLGKDGNCEDISKLVTFQLVSSLDSANKVFGINGIKVTLSSGFTAGNLAKIFSPTDLSSSKYYCLSGYLKNGNATDIQLFMATDGAGKNLVKSTAISDTTKFTRAFCKLAPSDWGNGSTKIECDAQIHGVAGQYAFVDGFMLEEISQAQYNDSNFQPSPYVDSYACLQNPYIEVRHDNLVRNGNGEEGIAWWNAQNTPQLTLENGYFKVTDDDNTSNEGCGQFIDVKEGVTYTITAIAKCGTGSGTLKAQVSVIPQDANNVDVQTGRLTLTTTATSDTVLTGTITILAGVNKVRVFYGAGNSSDTGTYYFKNIHMVEGVVPPSQYLPCRIERCVLEGKFADGDSLVLENGEVTGQINWKHIVPYGKDYDWQFHNSSASGVKCIKIPSFGYGYQNFSENVVKYDGSILPHYDSFTNAGAVSASCLDLPSNRFYLNILNSDSGWFDGISPNNDEVKAFMNGWKAVSNDTSRYNAWISILDGSVPSGVSQTTASGTNNGGQTNLAVANSNLFAVGNWILICFDNGSYGVYAISSINSGTNTITLSANLQSTVSTGKVIARADHPASSEYSMLTWCKNNIAPNYQGYQLHYKLQNPEPLNDVNTHIHGDIPLFDVGDNYLYLDSGIVMGEVANPTLGSGYANINLTPITSNYLKYKNEKIFTVFRNNLFDNKASVNLRGSGDTNINLVGYGYALINQSDYDTSATYTIDYKILATQAPQIGALACSYVYDIVSVLNKVQEEVNNRQNKDSILDSIVDSSLYEIIDLTDGSLGVYLPWVSNSSTSVYTEIAWDFKVQKKSVPSLNIQSLRIMKANGFIDITSKFNILYVKVTKDYARLVIYTNDVTTVADVRANGVYAFYRLSVDCRGRV